MRYKLIGITNDCFELCKTIMQSTDMDVLENVLEMLTHFPDYKQLEIVKA